MSVMGHAWLVRVGMEVNRLLGDRGRSHIIPEAGSWNMAVVQGSGGITLTGKAEAM